MLRRYAVANALFAFTRRLRPTNQTSLVVRGVEKTCRRSVGGVVEATSARRSRGNATGSAPQTFRVPGGVVRLGAINA